MSQITLAQLWELSEGPGLVHLKIPKDKPPKTERIKLPFLKLNGILIRYKDGYATAAFSRPAIRLKLIRLGYFGPLP
jgi:hypothetical protein